MAYYCRYSLGGTLDFLHFLQKSIYNINYWSAFGSGPLAAPFDFLPQFGGIQFKERRTSEKDRKKEREREREWEDFILHLRSWIWFTENVFFELTTPPPVLPTRASLPVWPDWAIYWTLGNFLKPLPTINLPKSPTFLGNFLKVLKSIIFLVI